MENVSSVAVVRHRLRVQHLILKFSPYLPSVAVISGITQFNEAPGDSEKWSYRASSCISDELCFSTNFHPIRGWYSLKSKTEKSQQRDTDSHISWL